MDSAKIIKLRSNDGIVFEVEKKCLRLCVFLKDLVNDLPYEEEY